MKFHGRVHHHNRYPHQCLIGQLVLFLIAIATLMSPDTWCIPLFYLAQVFVVLSQFGIRAHFLYPFWQGILEQAMMTKLKPSALL
jgi:hypothetical protein